MVAETEIGGAAAEFPGTRWTMILSSRENLERRKAALTELLATYWKPLYFFVRRKGLTIEAAKDAVQGFCTHLLERDFLARLDPGKGRFRSYLRTSIDHYLVNQHEKDAAWKRGGRVEIVPLDFDAAERAYGAGAGKPEEAYDREWALEVMERATARLRREFDDGTRQGPLEMALKYFGFAEPPSYADAAGSCGMGVSQFKAFLHRTRSRFRELVREEVRHTVPDDREADAEMVDLVRTLRS